MGFDVLELSQFLKELSQGARRVRRVGFGDFEFLETGEAVFSVFAFGLVVNDDAVKIESDAKFGVVSFVGFGGTAGKNQTGGFARVNRRSNVFGVGT